MRLRAFNLEQTEGIPWEKLLEFEERDINPIEECQNVVRDYTSKPSIKFGGGKAYYSPIEDYVQLPEMSSFKSSEGYYSTMFHELVHSTGHMTRLNRSSITDHNPFGSKDYSLPGYILKAIDFCQFCQWFSGIIKIDYLIKEQKILCRNNEWIL
ncbi:zincin-like metallopeptidase domain-containing protein [Candidatus Latescibacterota bacterium]